MKESNYQLAVALRRELHAHPELSNEERWTKAHLMDFLRRHTTHIELIDQGGLVLWRVPGRYGPVGNRVPGGF